MKEKLNILRTKNSDWQFNNWKTSTFEVIWNFYIQNNISNIRELVDSNMPNPALNFNQKLLSI